MNMPMSKFSDEYYERKCYLKSDSVPTQSVMKKKMSPALAKIYFTSMSPKLKVVAGLSPPLKGGGSDWFVPPDQLLKGRAVMKPAKKELLSNMGFNGIAEFVDNILDDYQSQQQHLKQKKLEANDNFWKKTIDLECDQHRQACEKKVANKNRHKIEHAFHQFSSMYATSLTKLEGVLLAAANKEFQRVATETKQYMSSRYETMLKQQATSLYDYHTARLERKQKNIKSDFIKELDETKKLFKNEMQEIHDEKHLVIEKLRNYLQCQNLACQVYVALKEKEECAKNIEESRHKHKKEMKLLTEQAALKDLEIKIAKAKAIKRQEFQNLWHKKICEVVKKFQLFVSYSLQELPEYAEFFINTEKLLLLQLDEVLKNPSVESIFEFEKTEPIHTPIPQPAPFYLYCDKSNKPHIDQNLCPKHNTSSTNQLPVVVVNKRCIYAACDNFNTISDKLTQYVNGQRGDDEDFEDHHDYTKSVPIKCTSYDHIRHLKLESSLQQLLQNEWANVRNLPLECCSCRVPYCFCSRLESSKMSSPTSTPSSETLLESQPPSISRRSTELEHEREPKFESYMEYVKSKKCKCPKMAKKHLEENMPPYMTQTSAFEAPELPHYEMCDLETLKKLVRKAKGKRTPPPVPAPQEPKTRDIYTQYSDQNFDFICNCFSDDEVDKFFKGILKDPRLHELHTTENSCKVVSGSITPSYLDHSMDSFATGRTYSLKKLLDDSPELEEIFRKKDC